MKFRMRPIIRRAAQIRQTPGIGQTANSVEGYVRSVTNWLRILTIGCCCTLSLALLRVPGFAQVEGVKRPILNRHIFLGKVGGRYSIRAELDFHASHVTGIYLFQESIPYSPKELSLSGELTAENELTLNEVEKVYQDGTEKEAIKEKNVFIGRLEGNPELPSIPMRIAGKWFGWGQDKPQEFDLTEILAQYRLVARHLEWVDKASNSTVSATYPQLADSHASQSRNFNALVERRIWAMINRFRASEKMNSKIGDDISRETGKPILTLPHELDISYRIYRNSNSLISLMLDEWIYSGGAHGSWQFVGVNYDMRSGKSLPLTYPFNPRSGYLKAISSACIVVLHRQYADTYEDPSFVEQLHELASANPDDFRTWNFAESGLLITFDEYQLGPHSMGAPQIVMPYQTLRSFLLPESWQRLTGQEPR